MNKEIDKLESVSAAFEHWRQTRTKQGKIPDYLWEQVKELIGSYSLTKICSTLKISHVQIKESITDKENGFKFVEVDAPTVFQEHSIAYGQSNALCSIELCRSSGDRLVINSLSPIHLTPIVTEFMR